MEELKTEIFNLKVDNLKLQVCLKEMLVEVLDRLKAIEEKMENSNCKQYKQGECLSEFAKRKGGIESAAFR